MSFRLRTTLAVLALASMALGAVVERIVAVVGERPILLSDVHRRARPFRARMVASGASPAQLAQAESQIYKELLQRMVDERLEELAAEKAKISITREEIDSALANVASNARMAVADLVREAAAQGLSEADYREELRRQLLEGRLYQLRGRGRPRASEAEARGAFEKWIAQPSNAQPVVHVALLPMRLAAETQAVDSARVADAQRRLAGGEDFCEVARDFSDDASARATCGDRGPQPVSALLPAIAETARTLTKDSVSGPIAIGDAIVFVRLLEPAHTPTFADVRDAMFERAGQEIAEKQRKAWLAELRAAHFVDVRL